MRVPTIPTVPTVPTGPVAGSLPENTSDPAIAGTPTSGNNLICGNGVWTGEPTPVITKQWFSAAGADAHLTYPGGEGVSYTTLAGQTGSTLALNAGHVGLYIFCGVTATNAVGSVSEPTADVGPVAAA